VPRFILVKRPRRLIVRTRDGWRLALHRYWKGDGTSRFGPVVLCHGLGANRHDLDAPHREISVAWYLHQRGHDVWVAELRGAGESRRPGWPLSRRLPFDFDEYVHRDIPAIIRFMLDTTSAQGLHWVGHSMGGMLAYAALEHFDHRLFRSVVTIGSPAFTAVKHPAVDQLYRLRFALDLLGWLPMRRLGLLGALFPGITLRTIGPILANVEHMEKRHVRQLAARALFDLPAPLLRQFAEWYGGSAGFSRADRLLDYCANLDRVKAPMLIIAGAGDMLTPLRDLSAVFEAIGSTDKKLLICGREQGFSLDYGHIDMVLGTRARDEVYPHIAGWIEQH